MRRTVLLVAAMLLAACGDKVPESEAARSAGKAPKQAVERAAGDVGKALQQGADRSREVEEKK
jgi:hypothetical protein